MKNTIIAVTILATLIVVCTVFQNEITYKVQISRMTNEKITDLDKIDLPYYNNFDNKQIDKGEIYYREGLVIPVYNYTAFVKDRWQRPRIALKTGFINNSIIQFDINFRNIPSCVIIGKNLNNKFSGKNSVWFCSESSWGGIEIYDEGFEAIREYSKSLLSNTWYTLKYIHNKKEVCLKYWKRNETEGNSCNVKYNQSLENNGEYVQITISGVRDFKSHAYMDNLHIAKNR